MQGTIFTIDPMHSVDFVIKGASPPGCVNELVESRQCGQSRPRESAEWMDVKTIDCEDQAIGYGTS
jgi:hypothetical protein